MVLRNLILELDSNEGNWEKQVVDALGGLSLEDRENDWNGQEVIGNQIMEGIIVRVNHEDSFVIVDIGGKSEGIVPLNEWDPGEEPPEHGQTIKVLVEEEDEEGTAHVERHGMIQLSRRKAAKIEAWDNMMKTVKEGDIVSGKVVRKIKGGLLVDIGVSVFLPASQVDIRRPNDIGEFIDKEIRCKVLKIDEARRNIVVSRRAMIESDRAEKRAVLLSQLNEGEIRRGTIKNIADFGAFIDLGGIDGLLHITDMSWGRVNHPNEMVKIDDEIEVVVLNVDREKEKISLGLKQKTASPWAAIEEKYPIGTHLKGSVVNVTTYGAFIKLEEGIEGLVHISEMSWTKRINHPNEMLNVGDEIDVVVLAIDQTKQNISLGIKQTQDNPWEQVDDKYPIGKEVTGIVRNLTNYGAFIEIEEGVDGLLHVSDMSWVKKITQPNEIVQKGQEVHCQVLSVDKKQRRIALGMKQLSDDPWLTTIPERFQPNQLVKGVVTKITNFGVFIHLEEDLEGLLHISELSDDKIENPEELVKVGDEIEVKILKVDPEERKIGLSRKRAEWTEEQSEAAEESATAHVISPEQLKGGVGDSGPLFKMPTE